MVDSILKSNIGTRQAQWLMAIQIRLIESVILLCALVGCGRPAEDPPSMVRGEGQMPSIEQVLERMTAAWMAIPGVVGTGLGLCDQEPCIKVFSTRPAERLDPPVPEEVDGYPVRVELTGPFRARDTIPDGG